MATLIVTDRNGDTRRIEGKPGHTVMELIRDAGFDDMLALCGGVCNCGTCHIHVDASCAHMTSPRSADEDAMLEGSDHARDDSRLACQIAFTEAIWVHLPPADKRDFMAKAGGVPQGLLTNEKWQAVMAASDLKEIVAEAHTITSRQEVRNQSGRAGFGDYMRSFGSIFKVLRNPAYRSIYKDAFSSMPKNIYDYMGYGIYAGRKSGIVM